MDKIGINKIKKINNFAIDLDWHRVFNGKTKGNRHLFRVVRIAEFLAQEENGSIEICQAGAWLHDVGLINGNKNHPKNGMRVADKFLCSLGISKEIRKNIIHCIEAHEGTIRTKTLEAKIVHDADVLDKSGVLGLIRHTWKILNTSTKDFTPEEISKLLSEHLKFRQKKLYSITAKILLAKINKKTKKLLTNKKIAIAFIKRVMQLIKQGFISDKIAQKIAEESDDELNALLKNQLDCTFLLEKQDMLLVRQRIKCFLAVRDIPFKLDNSNKDSSCIAKTKILADLLNRLGLSCKVATCFFNWEKIKVPEKIILTRKKLNKGMVSDHNFLRVFIPETKKWVTVDPTWDIELKKKFPIAEWDGLSGTILAVPVIKTKQKIINPTELNLKNFNTKDRFVKVFNDWLVSVRRGGQNGKS